jgi:hypothetical protein
MRQQEIVVLKLQMGISPSAKIGPGAFSDSFQIGKD